MVAAGMPLSLREMACFVDANFSQFCLSALALEQLPMLQYIKDSQSLHVLHFFL
jgi:hypothetical protein